MRKATKTLHRLADGWDARMRAVHGEITSCVEANRRYIALVAWWLDQNQRDADEWLDAVFANRPRTKLVWRYLAEDPGLYLAPVPKTREELDEEEERLRFEAIKAREEFERAERRAKGPYDDNGTSELYQRWVEKANALKAFRAARQH